MRKVTMDQFFTELQSAIVSVVRYEMVKIRKDIGDEHIYSAAMVTDSDCVTLFLAVNTEEALAERDKADRTPEQLTDLRDYYSDDLVDKVAKGTFSLNRYLPDEWKYSAGEDSEFNKISQVLFKQSGVLSNVDADIYDEVCEKFQNQFIKTVTLAFDALRLEGIFAPDVICFVSMSDDERASDIENASARRLNTPKQYKEFKTWNKLVNE